MAMLLNRSGAAAYFPIMEDGALKKLVKLEPAKLVEVSDSEYNALKKIPLFKQMMDEEKIATGAKAKKVGREAEKEIAEEEKKAESKEK